MLWLRGAIGEGISGGGGEGCGGQPGPKEKDVFGLLCSGWSGCGGNRSWLCESWWPGKNWQHLKLVSFANRCTLSFLDFAFVIE